MFGLIAGIGTALGGLFQGIFGSIQAAEEQRIANQNAKLQSANVRLQFQLANTNLAHQQREVAMQTNESISTINVMSGTTGGGASSTNLIGGMTELFKRQTHDRDIELQRDTNKAMLDISLETIEAERRQRNNQALMKGINAGLQGATSIISGVGMSLNSAAASTTQNSVNSSFKSPSSYSSVNSLSSYSSSPLRQGSFNNNFW